MKGKTRAGKQRELRLAEQIPYTHFVDAHTWSTRAGALVSMIEIEGISVDTLDDTNKDSLSEQFSRAISQLSPRVSLWVNRIRMKDKELIDPPAMPNYFSEQFATQYQQSYLSTPVFKNRIFVSIALQPSLMAARRKKTEWLNLLNEDLRLITEATDFMLANLKSFAPTRVRVSDEGNLPAMEAMSFLINAECYRMQLPRENLADALARTKVSFGPDTIKWSDGASYQNRYSAILSIKAYSQFTSAFMLHSIQSELCEYVVTHSFHLLEPLKVKKFLTRRRAHMSQVGSEAYSLIEGIGEAIDGLESGTLSFGYHHASLMVIADNLIDLNKQIERIKQKCLHLDLKITRNTLDLESAFFSQLPGNFNDINRKTLITSRNFSDMLTLANERSGYRNQNHLANALWRTQTQNGSPFDLNIHLPGSKHSPTLGHTTIIGPSGSGKSVLMLVIDTMMRQYQGRSIFFDRGSALEPYVRANFGAYFALGAKGGLSLNPIPKEDNLANRTFLQRFLLSLIRRGEEVFSARDENEVIRAVKGLYSLPESQRKLRNVLPFFSSDWELKDRMNSWLHQKNGDRAYLFDSDTPLEFICADVVGIDISELLKDDLALLPVLQLIFYQIDQKLEGTLTGIYLDEGWQFINSILWQNQIQDWLATLRKQNAYVVFATQDPNKITSSPLSYGLVQGASTTIYLPNKLADEELYHKKLGLSLVEVQAIKSMPVRHFLFKQAGESTVLQAKLEGLATFLEIASGTPQVISKVRKLIEAHGQNPALWLKECEK